MILQSIMAVRAEVAAEAVDKGLGTLRLQEKMNCVRQYDLMLKLAGISPAEAAKTHDQLKKEIREAQEFGLHNWRFSPFNAQGGKKRPREGAANDEEDEEK